MNSNSTPHATHGSGANQAGSFSISMKPPLTYEQQVDLLRSRGLIFRAIIKLLIARETVV